MNKELWSRFTENKTVVNCKTEEEAVKFLEYCHEQGMSWCDGDSLLESNEWEHYYGETCYNYDNENEMSYAYVNYYKEKDIEIITYKELFNFQYYFGDEILKMIREEQLKNNVALISEDKKSTYSFKDGIISGGAGGFNIVHFSKSRLRIVEQMTFEEARKKAIEEGRLLRYRNMSIACNTSDWFKWLCSFKSEEEINKMLDEQLWMVEDIA